MSASCVDSACSRICAPWRSRERIDSATSSSGTSSAIATTTAYCVPKDSGTQPYMRVTLSSTEMVSGT